SLTAVSNPLLAPATSNTLAVTPAAAAQLAFTAQPSNTTAGTSITPPVQVSIEDSYGNVVTADNSTTVTVAIGFNPGGGVLSGTLTQTVSAGVASFNNLSIT